MREYRWYKSVPMSATPDVAVRMRLEQECDGDDRRLFLLLDEARVHGARGFLRHAACPFVSLYRGKPAVDLAHVAPYLAQMPLSGLLVPWLVVDAAVAASALIVVADADLETLRTHFRRWLMVLDSKSGENFFRFYDPRVIQPFLEASTPAEAARFFGPVRTFLACARTPPVREPRFRVWLRPEGTIADEPPNAFDKFVLRVAHEERFAEHALERYIGRLRLYLKSQHPEHLQNASDEQVRAIIERARQLGNRLDLDRGRDVTILAQALVLGATPADIEQTVTRTNSRRINSVIGLRDRLAASDVAR